MLRFCCLGSGSEGNAMVVEAGDGLTTTRILLDNGFNGRQLRLRLARAGLGIEDLDAIVLTHEHSDHVGGVRALLRQGSLPGYCSAGTARAGRQAHERVILPNVHPVDLRTGEIRGVRNGAKDVGGLHAIAAADL